MHATRRGAFSLLTRPATAQDPDTKLLQQVAGSVRKSTEKNVRERCAAGGGAHMSASVTDAPASQFAQVGRLA